MLFFIVVTKENVYKYNFINNFMERKLPNEVVYLIDKYRLNDILISDNANVYFLPEIRTKKKGDTTLIGKIFGKKTIDSLYLEDCVIVSENPKYYSVYASLNKYDQFGEKLRYRDNYFYEKFELDNFLKSYGVSLNDAKKYNKKDLVDYLHRY
jgi:hypothetical protein